VAVLEGSSEEAVDVGAVDVKAAPRLEAAVLALARCWWLLLFFCAS